MIRPMATRREPGFSRVAREVSGYALAALIVAGCAVALLPLVAPAPPAGPPPATQAVVASDGYARHVNEARVACAEAIAFTAKSMGPDIIKVPEHVWQAAYWDCLLNHGAML